MGNRKKAIGIIDYQAGNLASVVNAFEHQFIDADVIGDPEMALDYSHLVLPGVGSFDSAMRQLDDKGWSSCIIEHVHIGQPLMGICLGMQVLFGYGYEGGAIQGLGILDGCVKKIDAPLLPHVGWNSMSILRDHDILLNINGDLDMYYDHSYAACPDNNDIIIATSAYYGSIPVVVAKNNVVGFQGHPEKSYPIGVKILKNFSMMEGIIQ